ncbi:nucleotide sugar dehydrogenase [Phormidium sp. CCY1219]|uniref:nucleotide sugar dehydrogenase n=1 Tax=Phormidium sp. CCY1219 TaxID=2886104 RepID=UPI002D1EC4D7|nr:nucleotide sugar dehydrogenase [Phormidium sp. CCY1219]MEB3830100.1 nucleotide sugar dehydrogenase [Phormidium sp. CCY1219]
MQEKIAIIGLGYVGLPLAIAIAKKFPNPIGFDINSKKISDLKQGIDITGEVSADDLTATTLQFTSDPNDLTHINFFIIAVPTPIDANHYPDLTPLIRASEIVGRMLQPGVVVVYESTVYPGVTEETCGAILARESGLRQGIDFKLGYSPERINPGDPEHRLETIVKVVSGEDPETLERVATVYETIIDAGVYRAPSIKVAESAKVIENIQRDLNIALMNELALIFDRLNIPSREVLAAAGTKWNFLPFKPGLVGGHCIGVDPYYLTAKAKSVGYRPEVILAGRRINDNMGRYIAERSIKLLSNYENVPMKKARVGILGITFKENVPDTRNTRVPDIVRELQNFGIAPLVHDPIANPEEVSRQYGITLAPWEELFALDTIILAVAHRQYLELSPNQLIRCMNPEAIFMDVKSAFEPTIFPEKIVYWSL